MKSSVAALLAIVSLASGCDRTIDAMDLERMIDQPYREPFEEARWFADRRAMRLPVRGTQPYSSEPFDIERERGRQPDGGWVAVVPLEIELEHLEAGRRHYEIFCAPCHGVRGHADTPVARNMSLRPPPSLQEARILQMPVGQIFASISEGAGLMPAYEGRLDVDERWGVVAYVRALQLSEGAEQSPDVGSRPEEVNP